MADYLPLIIVTPLHCADPAILTGHHVRTLMFGVFAY